MVGRVVVHGERRAREMEEVAATLREIDIEPIMAEAIVRRMDWSVEAGLKQLFGGEAPKSYRDVVHAVVEEHAQNGVRRGTTPELHGGARRTLCAFKKPVGAD